MSKNIVQFPIPYAFRERALDQRSDVLIRDTTKAAAGALALVRDTEALLADVLASKVAAEARDQEQLDKLG